MKTQAIIFPRANEYEMTTLTLDKMGAQDVLVRTLTTAISPGTERWTLRGKHMGTSFPCVPGYHRIGIVEDCGSEVTDLQVGDIVYGAANRWQEKDIISMFGAHVAYSVANANGYTFLSKNESNTRIAAKRVNRLVARIDSSIGLVKKALSEREEPAKK